MPPLPERNVVEKYKMTTDFIEQRRLALEIFLNRVVSCTDSSLALAVSWRAPAWPALHTVYAAAMQAAHTALQHSPDLQLFLEANETEFAIEVSRGDLEGSTGLGVNAAKKTLSGALQLFRTLGHSASNLYQRKTDDDEEDPEYLKAGSCALVVSCMCTVGVLGLGCVFLHHSLACAGRSGHTSRSWRSSWARCTAMLPGWCATGLHSAALFRSLALQCKAWDGTRSR